MLKLEVVSPRFLR